MQHGDTAHIHAIAELPVPQKLIEAYPLPAPLAERVIIARHAVNRMIQGQDDRLFVVIGPCSIHDPEAALDYAKHLQPLRQQYAQDLEIIMRTYFEKPRTTIGWKSLIQDPYRDHSYAIQDGLGLARTLLLDIMALDIPVGMEFLDTIIPHYLSDLVSWAAIGARTTESQIHRELASGLPMPVGFKNSTDGNTQVAVDAVKVARHPHHFLSITQSGQAALVKTTGNAAGHIILRGSRRDTNYDAENITRVVKQLQGAQLNPRVLVDCSHGNSQKDHRRQKIVVTDVCQQLARGEQAILGVMLESNLVAGCQTIQKSMPLVYGQSITDACIDLAESEILLAQLAKAVQCRRQQ